MGITPNVVDQQIVTKPLAVPCDSPRSSDVATSNE